MAKNHPHEVTYFNQMVGGLDGAFAKYETDYWGNSLRMGAEWLGNYVKKEKIRYPIIVSADGSIMQTAYYLKRALGSQYIPFGLDRHKPGQWDYGLVLSRKWKPEELLSPAWPPRGTIHVVKADHTVLCAVVKNPDYSSGAGIKRSSF